MSDIRRITEQLDDDVNKADIWVNGKEGESYTAKDGEKVPSIRTISKQVSIDVQAVEDAVIRAEEAAKRAEDGAPLAYLTHAELPKTALVGDVSQVTNDPNTLLNGYYVWNGAEWIYSQIQPANDLDVKKLQHILTKNDAVQSAVTFIDNEATRNVIANLLADGVFDLSGLLMNGSKITSGNAGITISDENGFIPIEFGYERSNLYGLSITPSNDDFLVVDCNGFVIFNIGENGIIGGLSNDTTQQANETHIATLGMQRKSDINHILTYGQSLSRGQKSTPVISTNQPFNNVMIASGIKSRAYDNGYSPSSFVPLVEDVVDLEGETPVSGCLNGLSRRTREVDQDGQWSFLGSSSGNEGYDVFQLSENGSSKFSELIELISDCKKTADLNKKSYSVWAMNWYQGESDYKITSADKEPFAYIERWLALMWEPLKKEIFKITKQDFSPYLFTYQVAAHRRYDNDNMKIALAQWRSSRMYDDVVLACPAYIFKTVSDNLHLTNEASWLMGEYTSRAIFQTMISRSGKFRPLEPISVAFNSQEIVIKFHVPTGKLVIDSALCSGYENAGFVIRDSDDVVIENIITSVDITSDDTISIKTNAVIPAGAKITYARGKPSDEKMSGTLRGARGNLRDEAGNVDTAISPLGNRFALHNACVMFEYSQKLGF